MHAEDIKAALRKNGHSQTSVAQALQVSKSTVCGVIYGSTRSDRIAKYISNILGKDRSAIWPGRYEPVEKRIKDAA